jgi:hypothetical protein
VEIFGLCGLVVAQPVLAVFGQAPEVFVLAGADGPDIVAFALLVILVPPLLLWVVGLATRLVSKRVGRVVHGATVAGLGGVLAAEVVKNLGWLRGWWLVPVAATAAVGVGVALVRWSGVSVLLRSLAVGPLLFLVAFLGFSPTGELLRPERAEAVALELAEDHELPPVVMVVFDEWPLTSIVRRDGTIDAQLFPNLARLGDDATWYRNATTVSNSTLYAVPSLLTGRMPEEERNADARSHPESLFTLLGGTYEVEAVEPMTRLCPASFCHEPVAPDVATTGPVASGLRPLLRDARRVLWDLVSPRPSTLGTTEVDLREVEVAEPVSEARRDRSSVDLEVLETSRPAGLAGLLHTFEADQPPTLHYLHLLLPHTPFTRLSTGEVYDADDDVREVNPVTGGADADRRGPAAWPANLDRQRLVHQVGYLDGLIGELVDRLERSGLYDDALIVVTADHGLAFEPGQSARGLGTDPVTDTSAPDLAWVPLFVKAPGQREGRVDDRNALTIDVLPTIADLLEIRLPWEVDGRSLAGRPRATPRKPFVRAEGSAFATYDFDPVQDLARGSELADVFERGVDRLLPPGRGQSDDRWYRAGPAARLVGRALAELDVATADGRVGTVDRLGSYTDVEEGEDLPALITGRVAGTGDGERIAVVLNGTVAGVVPTYTDPGGPGRFASLLLRRAFREGRNDVELYRVVDRGEEPVLVPVAVFS